MVSVPGLMLCAQGTWRSLGGSGTWGCEHLYAGQDSMTFYHLPLVMVGLRTLSLAFHGD